jgi:predicted nucleic acid-binding protein
MLSCEAVVAETCFLLKRSGFDPSLALQFIERDAVQLPFTLQQHTASVSSLFKRYENVPASLADAALIRMAEIHDSPLLLTTDSDFRIYRRHGRQTIPLVCP